MTLLRVLYQVSADLAPLVQTEDRQLDQHEDREDLEEIEGCGKLGHTLLKLAVIPALWRCVSKPIVDKTTKCKLYFMARQTLTSPA